MADKPNVVLFLTDGHRRDMLGCYGNELLETPQIDAFAAAGTRFDRCFCTHSVCMPTRASIYTGRYPHVHGVYANGVSLPRTETTMAEVFAGEGYATCAAGKIHFEPQQAYIQGPPPQLSDGVRAACPIIEDLPYYGFQEVHMSENLLGLEYLQFVEQEFPELAERARKRDRVPEKAHDLQWITSHAIDFIERQAGADQPFFCHCSYHELSPPSTPPEEFADCYDPADIPVPELREEDLVGKPDWYRQCYEGYLSRGRQPDEGKLKRMLATSYDQMRFIDKQFGRIVETLRERGLWENTVVLFTADHGLSFNDHFQWRHGPFLFDQVTNVPMLWHVPGAANAGVVTEELIEQVDIMPTILDLCGVRIPRCVQGQSMVPLVRGETGALGRESVLLQERQAPDLAARGLDPSSVTQFAIRTADWKLIRYEGRTYGELYDLNNDPGEYLNLWDDPTAGDVRQELEGMLLDRLYASAPPYPERQFEW